MLAAVALATSAPTAVDPVNAILSTPGCAVSAWPTAGPKSVTTLNTPGGKPYLGHQPASATAEPGE